MPDVIRWGILGAASFARKQMAPAIHAARGCELAAIATRNPKKGKIFQPLRRACGYTIVTMRYWPTVILTRCIFRYPTI